MIGQYYLHENGSLIYKRLGGVEVENGGFVRYVWECEMIGKSPKDFLTFLEEAKKLGANQSEIIRLIEVNKLDEYIENVYSILGIEK